MDPEYVQNLRYKLQKRVRRLNSVDQSIFPSTLNQFWRFFDGNPTHFGIVEQLMSQFPETAHIADRILTGETLTGETDEEAAAIGYEILRKCATLGIDQIWTVAQNYGSSGDYKDAVERLREVFLEPFYEYVDEHLDDQRAMLALLLRYKHRSEWFHRDRLWSLIGANPREAEKLLALDLYSYLYDQGIDFTIEPSSLTGAIDLIAAQGSNDPLLADTKIFDADGRSRAYIRKGFNQIYTYAQQFNEPFGYLIIFKTTDRDLRFSLSSPSRSIPSVVYNHKTIFLITIDIYPHPKPVSQRDPIRAVEITEEELIRTSEEKSSTSETLASASEPTA